MECLYFIWKKSVETSSSKPFPIVFEKKFIVFESGNLYMREHQM